MSNTTDATCGAGIANSPGVPEIIPSFWREEDVVEETRVTPTPTKTQKEEGALHAQTAPVTEEDVVEETRATQLKDVVQETYLRTSDSGKGLQDLDLEWAKLDIKEEKKGVSFIGDLLAQQSKMLKGFKKSPAPAARPAPKVGKFTGERSASRRKSLRFLDQLVPEVPEAAHIEQEKQESTDMSSAEDSCDQYVPPPSADDYSSDDSAVVSPSDEEAPPAKKRKEVSKEEKDLLDSSAKGFVLARTIAEFEAISDGTDVPAVAADVPAEESGSDTDSEADDPEPADEPVRGRKRRTATKVYRVDTKRPRRECQVEGCTAAVVNLRRQMTVSP
ncbi:uncharacterized protein LOC134686445 [Mytilus trossulus]|uniref:uncharacterized protein LOC134686445 n=1 Tax=Mytilus trossulus TaxID=6551 RepID=UPI003004D5E5